MTIGYITREDLDALKKAGATRCVFSISSTPQYRGDLTAFYFLADGDLEVAHQTQLSGLFGSPNINFFQRPHFDLNCYKRSRRFDHLVAADEADLVASEYFIGE